VIIISDSASGFDIDDVHISSADLMKASLQLEKLQSSNKGSIKRAVAIAESDKYLTNT